MNPPAGFMALTDFDSGKPLLVRKDVVFGVHSHSKTEGCTVVSTTLSNPAGSIWYGVRETVAEVGERLRGGH
jgi:hypothetical protein